MTVTETFFSVSVTDMERAKGFYVGALGASVVFVSPRWTSLRVAGVRLGLFLHPGHGPSRVGLHFVVSDLAAARPEIERAGGRVVGPPVEVAPGAATLEAEDTEGNTFSIRASS